jgi:hypothetical protein
MSLAGAGPNEMESKADDVYNIAQALSIQATSS